MKSTIFASTAAAMMLLLAAGPASARDAEKAAIHGCIEQMKKVGGPDARAGHKVLSSEYSEAGTLVMIRDAGGTVWRCIGYRDGAVGELKVAEAADDGEGAMAGAPSHSGGEGTTSTKQVHFGKGETGAELSGSLTPGSSTRYVLRAKNGQDLYVRVAAKSGDISYQIFNPDGSFLLDQVPSHQEYRGQLWQSGEHVVEVINRGNSKASYHVIFGIENEDSAGTAGSTSGTPSRAEQACLRDVTRETGNPDVVLLDSTFSEAGTEVIVGVGPQQARWRCIAYRDGTTGGIMSLTDEGGL